ncbi:hypothetical protein SAMN04488128_1011597 [Chitinophaga eiseniae]|uniref:DUF4476 domain-containing protein n=1 Tax=Chitinophaga eiseniae TaxID=634771 RepID=A0A1T4NHY6_9BACT|nr:hypothetical protein [Chitinophaga eiseniae]SJZ78814.1 hypothetical protein SAMN04488128_1011597 [Chitinophaga eiseniae]
MKKSFNLIAISLSLLMLGACSEQRDYGPFTVITSKQRYNNWDTGNKNTLYNYRIRYKGRNISPADVTNRSNESGYYISVQPLDSLPGKLLVHIAQTFNFPVYLIEEQQGKPRYWFLYNNGNQLPYQLLQDRYLVHEKAFSPEEGYFQNTIFDLSEDKQYPYRMPVSSVAYDVAPDQRAIAAVSGFFDKDTCLINTISLSDNSITSQAVPAALQQLLREKLNDRMTAGERKAFFDRYFRWELQQGKYRAVLKH